jgi:hypothetical protein
MLESRRKAEDREGLLKPTRREGVGEPALKPGASGEGDDRKNGVQSRAQNRIWEIRPSGMAGGFGKRDSWWN